MFDLRVQIPGGAQVTLPRVPVDQVGAEARAATFTQRSIKKDSKMDALKLAISMVDLTTLEGSDTTGKVRELCRKARQPLRFESLTNPVEVEVPPVAAICVYPKWVPLAKESLQGSTVKVASVSTAFPAGQVSMDVKVKDIQEAVALGADEIDMVIDRGAFLSGDYQKVFDEIVRFKDICGDQAHLKVILETGDLQSYDKIRLASWLAMMAGADFIKTSTGKVGVNATLPITLVMLQAIADYFEETGKKIGMKPAGGIRNAKQAIQYLVMVREVLGKDWLTPDLFRFGASSLLNDLLRQVLKQKTGTYYYRQAFSVE